MHPSSDIPGGCEQTQPRFIPFQDHEETLPPPIALMLGTAYISLFDPYEKKDG